MKTNERLAVGADHAGFALKRVLVEHLSEKGYHVVDVGTDSEESVDDPDCALKVGELVGAGEADLGILVCGSGLGVAIAANKVDGVRAVTANDAEIARLSREHNNANVLTLGARLVGEGDAKEIVDVWLGTEFDGGDRHQRRIDKISAIEKRKRS